MCTVHIRGHEANIYEAEARCHEVEIEAKARVKPRPNDLASRPRGPRGLNIPVRDNINSQKYVWIILLKMTFLDSQGKVATSDRLGGQFSEFFMSNFLTI